MNDEMIKYKKNENERARHTVNTLSVKTNPYIVDVLKKLLISKRPAMGDCPFPVMGKIRITFFGYSES